MDFLLDLLTMFVTCGSVALLVAVYFDKQYEGLDL